MNGQSNLARVFEKLSDLKSVFSYGQKIIPILQNLIDFMNETVPILQNVNDSISESANQMPKAQHHIKDVSNATELVTTEILDKVDISSGIITEIEKSIDTRLELENKRSEVFGKIKSLLNGSADSKNLITEYNRLSKELDDEKPVIRNLKKINDNLFEITLALQVQDITAQQLAAVNHLISAVQEKLASLMTDLGNSDINEELKSYEIDAPRDASFNPNAKYIHPLNDEKKGNSKFDEAKKITSQDEIDKLFS